MSKMSELSMVIDSLIDCGEKLAETGRALRAYYSLDAEDAQTGKSAKAKSRTKAATKAEEPEEAAAESVKESAPSYTKEDVRGVLAAKSAEAGGRYKAQVKAVITKYGGTGKLSDVPADKYAELVKEVEGMDDAE